MTHLPCHCLFAMRTRRDDFRSTMAWFCSDCLLYRRRAEIPNANMIENIKCKFGKRISARTGTCTPAYFKAYQIIYLRLMLWFKYR